MLWCYFFFFNDTATTEIYTLSLHDALPISYRFARGTAASALLAQAHAAMTEALDAAWAEAGEDRKSTRLNSSHVKRSRMPSSA